MTQKVFIALAIRGSGSNYEADARSSLDFWNTRVPVECLPAFERMSGVWDRTGTGDMVR